jgi:hypothetical protein
MGRITKLLMAAVITVSFLGMTVGCQKEEGTLEKIGKKADKTIEETKKSLDE